MNVRPFLESNPQPPVLGKPGKRMLYDPAMNAKAATMLGVAFCNDRGNAATAQLFAVRFGIVSAIDLKGEGLSTGAARLADAASRSYPGCSPSPGAGIPMESRS